MKKGGRRFALEASMREIIFGLEDSLVSTLGAVTGIAAGVGSSFVVILSGIVLIFVEALSMSAGSYLSSKTAKEVAQKQKKFQKANLLQRKVHGEALDELLKRKKFSKKEMNALIKLMSRYSSNESIGVSSFRSGIIMGLFYLSGGVLPLIPYFFLPVQDAIIPSIIFTAIILFAIGAWKAKIVHIDWKKSGFEMMSISLSAALLGFVLGRIVAILFGIEVV